MRSQIEGELYKRQAQDSLLSSLHLAGGPQPLGPILPTQTSLEDLSLSVPFSPLRPRWRTSASRSHSPHSDLAGRPILPHPLTTNSIDVTR